MNTINTYTLNLTLTEFELLCLKSFINNNYQVNIYTYTEITNLPKKIILKDANLIVPKNNLELLDNDLKNMFFKLKFSLITNEIIIEPYLYCLKFYQFPKNNFLSTSPDNLYNSSYIDFSIFKLDANICNYLIEHIELINDDLKKKYTKTSNVVEIFSKFLDKVFKLEDVKMDWAFSNTCNKQHWRTQIGKTINLKKMKSFKNNNFELVSEISKIQNNTYFIQIHQTEIFKNYPNYSIPNKFNDKIIVSIFSKK